MNDLGKKSILYFDTSSGFGGSARALADIVGNLDKNNFNSFLVIKGFGSQLERVKDAEIIILRSKGQLDGLQKLGSMFSYITCIIKDAITINSTIKHNKISIVHVNTNIMLGIPAILAARLRGIPCICHIRDTRKLIKREKFFARLVDKFITLNNNAYAVYEKDIPQSKIEIVHDGLNLDESFKKTNFRQEFNLDSAPLIGLIGRIIQGKGQREFILAAKTVLKIKPKAKFVIVGDCRDSDGNYLKELKELVRNENLENDIIFTGWRNDINNIISNLDILVQSTTTFPEGFGLTCVEAMALKKPVIATDIPGPRDIVVDGETGFLVPPGDIKVMAQKITYLLDNPEIAKKMGEAGRKRAEELFDIKKQVKKIEAIYEELLDADKPR